MTDQNTQTKNRKSTAKIISGIFATLSIIVSAYIWLSAGWFWVVWEVVASILVAFGCIGEWHSFLHPADKEHELAHKRKELAYITAVAIGVTMELVGLGHAIPEAVRLENRVEESRSNNLVLQTNLATTQAKVEELRSNNLELAKIGDDARKSAYDAAADAEKAKLERVAAEKQVEEMRSQNLQLQMQLEQMQFTAMPRLARLMNLGPIFKNTLDNFKGAEVVIDCRMDDPDGRDLQVPLVKWLNDCGWHASQGIVGMFGNPAPRGVIIHSNPQNLAAAKALESFLKGCVIDAKVFEATNANIRVTIGSKLR